MNKLTFDGVLAEPRQVSLTCSLTSESLMQEALEEQGISVTKSHVTEDAVYITYKSHATNSEAIVTELETVVGTIHEEEEAKSVQGAILHTKRPLIGRWEIDSTWLQSEQDQQLNEHRLLLRVLQTLRVISFK